MLGIDELAKAAVADVDVLRRLDQSGDHFNRFRDVDFLIRTPTPSQAQHLCSFFNDHFYGKAVVENSKDVMVVINMPVEQPIISCVAGFMECVAHLFGCDFDGWGCVAQK